MSEAPKGSERPKSPAGEMSSPPPSGCARLGAVLKSVATTVWETVHPWFEVKEVLQRLIVIPFRPRAAAYASIAIVAFGGLGAIVSYLLFRSHLMHERDLLISVVTYVLAILGAAVADTFFEGREAGPLARICTLAFALLAVLPSGIPFYATFVDKAPLGEVGHEMLLWWVAPCWLVWLYQNASDPKYLPPASPEQAAGGSPLRDL